MKRNVTRLFLLGATALTLASCSAGQVKEDSFKSSYAPINYDSGTRSINYCNAGAQFVRDERREDAYRKMHATCAGRYQIVREETMVKAISFCSPTQRIVFQCVDP